MRHRIPIGLALAMAGLLIPVGSTLADPAHAPGIIITVAGNGALINHLNPVDVLGDGGPAINASLDRPADVAVNRRGNLFISDSEHHRIRYVRPDGTIITLVGNGSTYMRDDPNGDGGFASGAALDDPWGIALDSQGGLLIADITGNRVRRVDPNNIISTFAGSDPASPNGGLSGAFSGDGGPAVDAELNGPMGVAVAPDGSVIVADVGNRRIRRVDPGGIITTLAGGVGPHFGLNEGGLATRARLLAAEYVAVDTAGNVYFSDDGIQRVRKVAPDGTITTVAGIGEAGFYGDGGQALGASLDFPRGLAVDPNGNLFIADSGNQRVRKVTPAGIISTVAGSSPDGSNPSNNFSGDGGPATQARLYDPEGLALDSQGNLFIADSGNNRVREVFAVAAAVPVPPPPLPGDLNGDGRVTVADAVLALRIALGLIQPTPTQLQAGDLMGGMGVRINVADATLILRRSLGL